jgi:hypothetical protein
MLLIQVRSGENEIFVQTSLKPNPKLVETPNELPHFYNDKKQDFFFFYHRMPTYLARLVSFSLKLPGNPNSKLVDNPSELPYFYKG